MNATAPQSHTARASRTDGIEARSRLLHTALALFAAKGFSKTSTREIARTAGANIAAISYYFGDKAGLYAATFIEPMGGNMPDLIALYDAPDLPIADSLRLFMTGYLEPLKHGDIVRQCMRLHLRELLEPTGVWATEMHRDVRAPHEALARVLCRHLQIAAPDDDVQRLAFAISGMATQLFVMRDVVELLDPQLLGSPQQIDSWADRLVGFALALVASETQRREEEKEKKTRAARPAKHLPSSRKRARTTVGNTAKQSAP